MADETQEQQRVGESCGDECVIDLSKLKERHREQTEENGRATLILLTRGTYGHHDDGFSAIQVGNAVLAEEERATLLLLDDGVYFAMKGQNPSSLGLPNNLRYVEDFLDLGGRILVLEDSLKKRGLSRGDLVDGVEIISYSRMVKEVESHQVSVTF
jgi:sulfur relay protein TusB/DsrH